MEISDLYDIASAHDHQIYDIKLQETKSFCVEDSGTCYIALADDLSQCERKEKLAHEIGHCEYGGFYNIHSRYDVRSRAENRANRWAYINLLPLNEIQQAICNGCSDVWQLADKFSVSPEFMTSCLRFYIDQLGVTFG